MAVRGSGVAKVLTSLVSSTDISREERGEGRGEARGGGKGRDPIWDRSMDMALTAADPCLNGERANKIGR